MSARKGRGAKVLKGPQVKSQQVLSVDSVDTHNLSAIEKDSLLEGLQNNYGNPLHSTALEEDLKSSEEGQTNKGKENIPQTLKTSGKQRGAAMKRRETERNKENEKEETERKRRRTSSGGKVKTRPETEGETRKKKGAPQGERGGIQPTMTANRPKHLVGKKPTEKRRARQTPAVRPVKNLMNQDRKESKSSSGESSDPQSQDESDTDTSQQARKKILSSDEELMDDDVSWKPSPKKARVRSLGRTRKSSSDRSNSRKSSSGSASAEAEHNDKQRRRRHSRQGRTELEVVLDAFTDFCDQYRESVESKAVQQSIDSFSFNVKGQLMEKISSYKELRVLKRENAKVGSLIRTKTQRLLDAKYELMRAEKQAGLLQKEKAELKRRLADLRRGQAFLHDLRELNRQYLDFRHKHPREKETYGANSLPALLLETKHIHAATHQQGGIKHQLKKRQKKSGTRK